MFTLLLAIALMQQWAAGSVWTLAVTAGELLGSVILLIVSIKKGVGGWNRLDIWCYVLLAMSLAIWAFSKNALVSLHITVLADLIAFTPVLVKTWRKPKSETPFFYVMGVIVPVLNIVVGGDFSYAVILFPMYLAVINAVELLLINRRDAIILK
jgi:hypothetical protein